MNRKRLDTPANPGSDPVSQTLQPFNLVVIYDEVSVARASETRIKHLFAKCVPLLDIHKDEWSASELAHPEFAREAVQLAAACDMLVVATREHESLPSTIIPWLNCWLQRRSNVATTLVWLAGAEGCGGEWSPVHDCLEDLAQRHKLPFFASSLVVRSQSRVPSPLTPQQDRLLRLYQPQPDGWGINE